MAMVTPVGVNKGGFDATEDAIFSFYSVGGNQVVANRINIYDNETGNLVYTNKITTYSFSHTVPSNTLVNGKAYNFTFNTYDIDDNESLPSSPILFYCYATPTFEFINISDNQQINTSSYDFMLHYNQTQGELVYFVTFYLYDHNNNLVKQSEDIYSTSTSSNVTFNYLITGLDNNASYYIKASGYTRNNISIETDKILFTVRYDYPSVFTNLEVTNLCDKGYNQIISNITKLNGVTYPRLPKYIDNNTKLDLLDITNRQEVLWESKHIIDNDFGMQIWFEVGLEGKYFKLTSGNGNGYTYMIGKLVREIPYGRTKAFDYVEITGYVNNVEKFYMRSNYVELVNNTAYLILNFKYAPSTNTYSLVLNVYNQEDNYANWKHYKASINSIITSDGDYIIDDQGRILGDAYGYEPDIYFNEVPLATNDEDNVITDEGDNIVTRLADSPSNIEYNRLTNLLYGDNLGVIGANKANKFDMGTDIFPISKIELFNGIYDHIEFYKDYNREYSTDYTSWSYNTYMLCNFNNNINGGSLDFVIENVSSVKIKAREVGQFDYVTLYNIPIVSEEDLTFTVYDYRVPNGYNIEYSMVLIQNGDIEGQYITTTVESKWRRLFVSDDTMTLSLIGNVSFGNITKHVPTGVLQPIGSKYPTVIRNSNVNYYSGSVSGTIMCDDYTKIDRAEFVKLRETWCDFLTNGKTKVIKDWNGNIFIAQISDEPSISLNQTLGNSIGNIGFSFVEQGKWNNQDDLYRSGIVKTL